ncbi:MAG: YdcH family protein [Pseudomonadota bacterium]
MPGGTLPPNAADDNALLLRIGELETRHADLDQAVTAMEAQPFTDRLALHRLKKQKLALKDEIAALRDQLHPDIIA